MNSAFYFVFLLLVECLQVSSYISSSSISVSHVTSLNLLNKKPQIFSPVIKIDKPSVSHLPPDSTSWQARIALLTVSAFYGTNFGCVKILNQALEPSFSAACRFTLAALVFSPYFLRALNSRNPNSTSLLLAGVEVGFYCSLGYWSQAQALITSSASTVAFICSLAVIVVPILDLVSGQPKTKSFLDAIIPALLATAGVACLEFGGHEAPSFGDLYALIQPLTFGLAFWRVESHISKLKGAGDVQAFTGATMLSIGTLAWMWAFKDLVLPNIQDLSKIVQVLNGQFSSLSDTTVLAAVGWTGIVTTAITTFVENNAMKKLTASEASVIYSTEPLWGSAFAAVTLGETLGWNTFLGAFFILSACLYSSLGPVWSTGLVSSTMAGLGDTVDEVFENFLKNIDVVGEASSS